MKHLSGVVVALIATTPMAYGQSAAPPPKPESPFLQCDGQTGYVSSGETLGRLLAITLTAGLSEAGTRKPDVSKRLAGLPGAAACDAALAQEGNGRRRIELGLARTIHYLEAEDYTKAVESARATPALGGAISDGWDVRHTAGASALYLEAVAWARQGKLEEAEDTALRSAALAELDVRALQRTAAFASLTPRMTDAKRAYFDRAIPLAPGFMGTRAIAQAWVADYAGAAQTLADYADLGNPFFKKHSFWADGLRAVYLAMAGDIAQATALAGETQTRLEDALAAGEPGGATEEHLAFVQVAALLAQGKADEARALFGARGKWLETPAPAVFAMANRLRKIDAGPALGLLKEDSAALRSAHFQRAAALALKRFEDKDAAYGSVEDIGSASSFQKAAARVWRTDKSKFLITDKKNEILKPGIEGLVAPLEVSGFTAGEAILLHAALLAQARGKTGFTVGPGRTRLDVMILRFGNIGEPGFPTAATNNAASIIEALSPHIPKPLPSR